MRPHPVTLQISLAPSDYAHARHLLPHQVAAWRGDVAEILLTVDLDQSAGRFSDRWEEGRDRILPLANSIPGARVLAVDYGAASRERISGAFFGGRPVPKKDFRGGPFFSYFFGLAEASHDHVLHADSDMFFGGNGPWLTAATQLLSTRPQVLVTAPLPGPPSENGTLRQLRGRRVDSRHAAYDFDEMSTRLFLMDRRRFGGDFGMLTPSLPSARGVVKALFEGNPAADLPEHLFTRRMRKKNLVRHEFSGPAPGRWHIHPPYRCTEFYSRLPELIQRVETGDLPPDQLGDHDINDSLVDWSEAREKLRRERWWSRLFNRFSA